MVVHRLLVRLLKLFSDVLAINESILVRLPGIVKVRVEVEELSPGQIDVVNMLVHLLAHVDEVFSRHRVVNHCCAARLFIALRSEEGTLLAEVVDLLAGVREHVLEGPLGIVQCVHGRSKLIRGAAPFCDVLSPEKPFFALVEVNALRIEASKRFFT